MTPAPKLVEYRKIVSVAVTPPAVPLVAVTAGCAVRDDLTLPTNTDFIDTRPVIALQAAVVRTYTRLLYPGAGETTPRRGVSDAALARDGYHFDGEAVEHVVLVLGEFGPEPMSDSGNTVSEVVPAADLPLSDERRAELIHRARAKWDRRPTRPAVPA